MKTHIPPRQGTSPAPSQQGLTLIETLVYIALLSLIMVLSYECYYRTEELVRRMTRNCDDIMAAQRAGESWRNAVRHAHGGIQITNGTNPLEQIVTIPGSNGPTWYRFRDDAVWVQSPMDPTERRVLNRVLSSQWVQDQDPNAQGWRWELELRPLKHGGSIRPLFTFMSVAGKTKLP